MTPIDPSISFAIFGFTGLVGETGDFANPGDEIFRILISTVPAVPVQAAELLDIVYKLDLFILKKFVQFVN